MFKFKKSQQTIEAETTHQQNFTKLCQLCSSNFSKEEVLASDIDWGAVWKLALRHRVVPVMADRIKQLGITVPDDIADLMERNVQQNLFKGMKQAAELVRLTELFNEEIIPFLAFKGIALNHLAGLTLNQRHTGDIDLLLAEKNDLWKADKLLQDQGYKRKTPAAGIALNTAQKQYLLKYGKDLTYWHPKKKINLELHFKLCNNNYTLPLKPSKLYAQRACIKISTVSIPVMSKTDHQLYLLIHGAVSHWFRLKWLCDIPSISNNGRDYLPSEILLRAKNLGVERMAVQGLWLAYEQLDMQVSAEANAHQQNRHTIKQLIQVSKRHQLCEEPLKRRFSGIHQRFHFMLGSCFCYSWQLRSEFNYKMNQLKIYSINPADWQTCKLPPKLFLLYYPLRPILWLKRQLLPNKTHAD